jgi:hypothetical protein
MISEELVFLSFLYIKLFERVVEVVFNKSIVSSSAERGRVVYSFCVEIAAIKHRSADAQGWQCHGNCGLARLHFEALST